MSKGALAAAVLSFLVTPPAAAFDPDFHFHATYVVAREVGLSEAESLEIARGAWAVDSLEAGALSSVRPFLRAAVTAVALPTVVWPIVFALVGEYDSLADWFGKLSDFVIAPAAVAVHFPRMPGEPRVTPFAGRSEHDAGRLVALAFETRDPVLLGIALHAVQDSHSHSGLLPASHLGTMLLLDTLGTPTSRNRARAAVWETYRVLSQWANPATGAWPGLRERFQAWFREGDLARLYAGVDIAEPAVPESFPRARERVRALVQGAR